ncbi:MAG TPA: tetratricopeptide repeat protein, partial [Candidatus Limnocylindrales bacterium]|nr:tetratricopeptide repeat protein [Candidatus Limnocylindrales bacterium]
MNFHWSRLAPPLVALCGLALFSNSALCQSSSPTERERVITEIQDLIDQNNLDAARLRVYQAQKGKADPGLDNLLGVIEAKAGDYAGAERSFTIAIRRAPTFTAPYLNLARLYQENANRDPQGRAKALALYEQLLRLDPANAEANYQAAVLLMEQRQYKKSQAYLFHLPPDSQDNSQALAVHCADLAGVGDRTRTDQCAARLRSRPDFSEADAQTIAPALASAKREDLIVALEEPLAKRRTLSGQSLHTLGLAYEKTGRLSQARSALEQAFSSLSSSSTAILLDLARIGQEQKDYKGSLGYLAHAEDLDPKDATIPYYFGILCLQLNLLAEAQRAMGKALALDPDNPSYNYSMGAVTVFSDGPEQAIPYFQKYLRLKPKDPRAQLALGAAYVRAKNYAAGLPMLRESANHSETASTAHYYLGRILNEEGDPQGAIQELRLSLKSNTNYPDALAELGRSLLTKKDYRQAQAELDHALALSPDHYQANLVLLTLYTKIGDARRDSQSQRVEELKKAAEEKSQE